MKDIEIIQLFSSNVYIKKTDIKNLKNLTDELKNQINYVPNTIMSNVGGVQLRFDHEKSLNSLNEVKSIIVNEFKNFPKFKFESVWLNINNRNNFNISHTHPGCDYAGVIYLKVPENSGSIRFQNPNAFGRSNYFEKLTEKERKDTFQYPQYQIFPEEGDILLFPADLPHYVMPNNSEEERISLAFNINFV